ncbi:MAG: 50S ribosomal protein L30e [Candidatus Bathyarchaeia archaeon]
MDVETQLKLAVKTGEVSFGFKQALEAAISGKAKMIILASNCPPQFRRKIQVAAETSKIPIHLYKGSSLDLGFACGKRFAATALTVKKPGDSEILRLVEA